MSLKRSSQQSIKHQTLQTPNQATKQYADFKFGGQGKPVLGLNSSLRKRDMSETKKEKMIVTPPPYNALRSSDYCEDPSNARFSTAIPSSRAHKAIQFTANCGDPVSPFYR